MTGWLSIFLVLGALYLMECFLWCKHGALILTGFAGKNWHHRIGPLVATHPAGGFAFARLLPPFAATFRCTEWPILPGPRSILLRDFPLTKLQYGQIHQIEITTNQLIINDRHGLALDGESAVITLDKFLERIMSRPADKRLRLVGATLRATMNTGAVSARVEAFGAQSRVLRFYCHVMLFYLFVFAPAISCWQGLARTWLILVIGIFCCSGFIVREFFIRHRQLYPRKRGERWQKSIIMFVSPVEAVRAVDQLSRQLLLGFHPLAAAAALCSQEDLITIGRYYYYDGSLGQADPEAQELLREQFDRFLIEKNVLADVTAPPQISDGSCRSYCPRCHALYTSGPKECSDCPGVQLIPRPAITADDID